MIIKSLKKDRINVDKRGKITTGIKVVNQRGVEYPKAVDYFVITDFKELVQIYGEKPKKLVIVFPSDEIEDFFQASFVLYGANNQMIRKCDGEECIHRIKETVNLVGEYDELGNIQETEPYDKTYEAGEISECICKLMPIHIIKNGEQVKNTKRCNMAMYMKAFVIDYKTKRIVSPNCYMFYSGSENTASNIYSELVKIKNLFGRIKGFPFGLSVDMVSGKTNANVKYPIWNLQILGDMTQLELANKNLGLLDFKMILEDKNALPEPAKTQEEPSGLSEAEQMETPKYWIEKIKALKNKQELKTFLEKHITDISIFTGREAEEINEEIKKAHQRL